MHLETSRACYDNNIGMLYAVSSIARYPGMHAPPAIGIYNNMTSMEQTSRSVINTIYQLHSTLVFIITCLHGARVRLPDGMPSSR